MQLAVQHLHHDGLPPTPIGNPGVEAMNGAAHPAARQLAVLRQRRCRRATCSSPTASRRSTRPRHKCHVNGWGCASPMRAAYLGRRARPAGRALAVPGAAPRRLRRARVSTGRTPRSTAACDELARRAGRAAPTGPASRARCRSSTPRCEVAADGRAARAARSGRPTRCCPAPRGWVADNTDVAGIVAALRRARASRPASATVLGAGGTAQAALAALLALGVRRVHGAGARPGPGRRAAWRPARGSASTVTVERARRRRRRRWTPSSSISTLPPGAADRLAGTPGAPGRPCSTSSTPAGPRRWRPRPRPAGRHGGQRRADAAAPGRGAGVADDRPRRAGAAMRAALAAAAPGCGV